MEPFFKIIKSSHIMESTTLRIKTLSLFTAVALFVGIGVALGFNPFSDLSSTLTTKIANTEFSYIGDDASFDSLTEESNWIISNGAESCDLGSLPCVVAPDMPSIANESQLVSYLKNLPSEEEAETFVESKTTKHRD